MLRKLVAIVALAALSVVALAQPVQYASRAVKIRAGVLLIESQRTANNQALNAAPHVWSNLELDKNARPPAWTFENPLGRTTMTAASQLRWVNYGGSITPGRRLDKRRATYWEVALDQASDQVLATYDVLSLSVRNLLSLNSREREKLRRFVDQGGLLWIDVLPVALGDRVDIANPGPVPFELGVGSNNLSATFSHPLLNSPNPVSLEDLQLMQFNSSTGDVIRAVTNTGAFGSILSWLNPDSQKIEFIAGDVANGATVALGQVGEGYVLLTTRGVSATLSSYTSGDVLTLNDTFYPQPPALGPRFTAAAKLIVNAISLSTSYRAGSRGARRLGSSAVDIVAPLLKRFGGPVPGGGVPSQTTPPIVFRDRVIASLGGQVAVLDAQPNRDLDGDGNPDDGVADTLGSEMDVLWRSTGIPGPLSSPIGFEVPNSNFFSSGRRVTSMVAVRDGNGVLYLFDLEPPGPITGNLAPLATIAPPDSIAPGSSFAPAFHEGLIFCTDVRQSGGLGRVWLVDAATGAAPVNPGNNNWVIQNAPRLSPAGGAPTVGYIPIQDNSGGLDRVVYVPTSADGPRSAGLASVWIGSRGEEPLGLQDEGANLRVQTRASINGIPLYVNAASSLGVKISVVRANGDPVPFNQLGTYLTGAISQSSPGELLVGITGTGDWNRSTASTADDVAVRVDYTLDWSRAGQFGGTQSDSYLRGRLFLPDQTTANRQIVGNIALAPSGNLFVVQSGSGNAGGTFYCIKEEGRGDFKLLYRWDLHNRINYRINPNSASTETFVYDPTFVDFDGLARLVPFLGGSFSNLIFASGPTVRGNTVYVVARGSKGFIPSSMVVAFDSDPQPVEFEINGLSPGFALAQMDPNRSVDKTTLDVTSTLQSGQFSFEQDPSPSSRGRIRMSNMAVIGPDGRIRDSISTSLPVLIRRSGQPDIVVEPEAGVSSGVYVPGNARGRWSPLRWYSVLTGYTAQGQPLVTGNTLYLGGASAFPSIISGGPFTVTNGLLSAIDATISDSDPFLFQPVETASATDPARTIVPAMQSWPRPWMRQYRQIIAKPDTGPPDFFQSLFNPAYRWPQTEGIQSFEDLRIRVLQAAVSDSIVHGVVGGEGVVVTWGPNNLYAFSRTDIMVVDEGRVGRFDTSGNPIWATDATLASGPDLPVTGTGNRIPLSRPTRFYSSGPSAYWIVDTGNDRVVRIDTSGRELRTLTGFKVDPNFRPDGMLDNSSIRLRSPRDLITYTTYRTPANNPLSNPRPNEYWIHYVIADTGNFRIVEVVDRYEYDPSTNRILNPITYTDPNSNRPGGQESGVGVLFWHSPAELSGKQYAYNSIDRLFVPDGSGGTRPVFAFGFGNFEPGRSSFGLDTTSPQLDTSSGFGGIVILDGGSSTVLTEYQVPAIGAGLLWQDQVGLPGGGSWNSPALPSQVRKIAGLSSVTLRGTSTGYAIMFTDTSGAYEVNTAGAVTWMMPNEVYRALRRFNYTSVGAGDDTPTNENPMAVRFSFARRLDSGDVILVNSYYGRTRSVRDASNTVVNGPFGGPASARDYFGEVVIVDGDNDGLSSQGYSLGSRNLGFGSLSLEFKLPPIKGARDIVSPIFGDRR